MCWSCPELERFSAADFQNSVNIIPKGEEATLAQSDALKDIRARVGVGASNVAVSSEQIEEPFMVNFIELDNDSVLSDRVNSFPVECP